MRSGTHGSTHGAERHRAANTGGKAADPPSGRRASKEDLSCCRAVTRALQGGQPLRLASPLRLLAGYPLRRRRPARLVGLGTRPEQSARPRRPARPSDPAGGSRESRGRVPASQTGAVARYASRNENSVRGDRARFGLSSSAGLSAQSVPGENRRGPPGPLRLDHGKRRVTVERDDNGASH